MAEFGAQCNNAPTYPRTLARLELKAVGCQKTCQHPLEHAESLKFTKTFKPEGVESLIQKEKEDVMESP